MGKARNNYNEKEIPMGEEKLRTVEPDDLFRLKFLQEARLSPDGKVVVYAVSHIEKDKEEAGKDDEKEEVEDNAATSRGCPCWVDRRRADPPACPESGLARLDEQVRAGHQARP
jgi:hypothetical protein